MIIIYLFFLAWRGYVVRGGRGGGRSIAMYDYAVSDFFIFFFIR